LNRPSRQRSALHLVRPLGLSLDEREVKRAGLDYREHVDLRGWPSWEALEGDPPAQGREAARGRGTD
jgi:tRNA (cytidine/uridine-2'-O-)-methyltransferase